MEIGIQIVILFVLLILYFSSTNAGDASNWSRALVISVALPLLGMLPNYLGVIGWLAAIVLSLMLISKILGQSISGSFFFLIILGLLQYLILLGVQKYIP